MLPPSVSIGYHAYRFGDSSINSVGGDAGKLLPDGQTDLQPDRQTDGWQTVTHNPLYFIEKH